MTELTATTKPTLDDVKQRLEAGELVLTNNTFSIEDLAARVFQTQAVAEQYAPVIDKMTETKVLTTLRRLLELGGLVSGPCRGRARLSLEIIRR